MHFKQTMNVVTLALLFTAPQAFAECTNDMEVEALMECITVESADDNSTYESWKQEHEVVNVSKTSQAPQLIKLTSTR